MARRAELFVGELSDGEAAHLLRQVRRGRNAVISHRAMLLFASFQGQSVSLSTALVHGRGGRRRRTSDGAARPGDPGALTPTGRFLGVT